MPRKSAKETDTHRTVKKAARYQGEKVQVIDANVTLPSELDAPDSIEYLITLCCLCVADILWICLNRDGLDKRNEWPSLPLAIKISERTITENEKTSMRMNLQPLLKKLRSGIQISFTSHHVVLR